MNEEPSFPDSAEEVLLIIRGAEHRRKFAWSAGRVVQVARLTMRWSNCPHEERKRVLKDITNILELLANQGILRRRDEPQSIGYGRERGFDYIGSTGEMKDNLQSQVRTFL